MSVGGGGGCGWAGWTRGDKAGSELGRCPGVSTSSSSSLAPNNRLDNDLGESGGSDILTTIEYHYT